MKNIRSTLATVWRIASPYFNSEDKWAGRGLLAAVIVIELAIAIDVLLNQWNARFYNALQDRNWDIFVYEIISSRSWRPAIIAIAVYQLYLNQWLQIRWRRWMTGHYLGEWLDRANHYRMQFQGDAADNPDQRISDDVKLFVEHTMDIGLEPAELDRDAVVLCRHPVGPFDRRAAAPVRPGLRYPRLSGLGRADLCHARHRIDASDRLAAGRGSISSSSNMRRISASTWCGCGKTPSRSR